MDDPISVPFLRIEVTQILEITTSDSLLKFLVVSAISFCQKNEEST